MASIPSTQQPLAASRPKHVPALDGVRGLAVLMVFIFHYGGGTHSALRVMQIFGFVNEGGWSGVVLFFVLSGFLITGILWDSYSDEHWWRKFFARRSLRIFPLYFLTLLVVVLAAIPAGMAASVLSHIWVPALFLEDMPYLNHISESLASPLPIFHLWSIAVEEQFYLLWPFILFWCWQRPASSNPRRLAQSICSAVFFGSLLFRIAIWLSFPQPHEFEHFLITQAGALAAGGWLALALRGQSWTSTVRFAPGAAAVGLLGFVAVGIAARSFQTASGLMMTLGLFCVTIFFSSLLALSLQPGWLQRVFSVGWLRWLGNVSYGVYVFHVLLLPVFHRITDRIAHGRSQMVTNLVQLVVAAVLSVTCAAISFRLFESQFLRLKKYFVPQPKARAAEPVA